MFEQLLEDLKADEGFRGYAYRDTEGLLTIGYGFLIDERRAGRLPQKIADEWLREIAFTSWQQLIRRLPWLLDQPEDIQRAMANMAYQMGPAKVCLFTKMINALLEGDREKAADEALDSKWARQTPNRARRVAALIRGD